MALADLFGPHRMLRGVIEAVLEGHLGKATTVGPSAPAVARLDIGYYAIFGGDPTHPDAAQLVHGAPAPIELVVADDQRWRDLLVAIHGARLEDRPMRTFATHALDPRRLADMASDVPEGFAVTPLDAALAEQLDGNLEPHALQVFPGAADFVLRGSGFGVVHGRDGGKLVSASTSYTFSSRHVEVSISTHPDFRGRGLARIAAAAMIATSLRRGLTPDWSASNPVSKRLALSLGYLPGRMCDIFYLE